MANVSSLEWSDKLYDASERTTLAFGFYSKLPIAPATKLLRNDTITINTSTAEALAKRVRKRR